MKAILCVLFLIVARVRGATSEGENFIGYSWEPTGRMWAPESCQDSVTYAVLGDKVGCNSPGETNIPIACKNGNTLMRTQDSSEICRKGSECMTWSVYESKGASTWNRLMWCRDTTEVKNPTFYRQNPAETTATATPGPSLTGSSATATVTIIDHTEPSAETGSSQAWIAGAVIGPVAGCAILAGVAWWLLRKKNESEQNEAIACKNGRQNIAEVDAGSQSKGPWELSAPRTFSRTELPS